jgi:diguanylate cyclase (GGDEF)-like protein
MAPAALLGRRLPELLRPIEGAPAQRGDLGSLAAAGPFQGAVFRCRAAGGEPCVLRVAGKPVSSGDRVLGYRGIATDITAEVAALEQARFLAQHDALTGLPNRTLMSERLAGVLARCRRRGGGAALLCLDLDGFKEVNDTLGHAMGDLLLVRCAERLRGSDSVARQGGDEFTILQDEVQGAGDVEGLCRRIVTVLAKPFDLQGREAQVRVSTGVALVPEDGHDPVQLLQRADMALYRAKNGGRNRYCFFEPGMDRQLRRRRHAEAALRRAPAEGEFQVRYQPQVACATGAVVGVEALVRWQHPQRGILLPAEFLPLAEETGLINALGAQILTTACRDAVLWGDLTVAVNVSAIQFRQRDFAGTVAAALQETGLSPSRLELDVTEGLLIHDNGDALMMLAEIKALGMRITMDDFGTGYSSLAHLQRFPFDKIKIDCLSASWTGATTRGPSSASSFSWARALPCRSAPRASRPPPSCASCVTRAARRRRAFCSRIQRQRTRYSACSKAGVSRASRLALCASRRRGVRNRNAGPPNRQLEPAAAECRRPGGRTPHRTPRAP